MAEKSTKSVSSLGQKALKTLLDTMGKILPSSVTGHPVRIVSQDEEGKWFVDNAALSAILSSPECRSLPACVVSIAGDFRKGKSFMLNFFLRYLHHIEKGAKPSDPGNKDAWLGGPDEPLKGFDWHGGASLVTKGILFWSRPFIVTTGQGVNTQDLAVFLMDTQGAFDSTVTIRDSALVFSLGTLISSIEIFNLKHNIQEDNLQVLQLFTDYGRLVLEGGPDRAAHARDKPFQNLIFLIRDWEVPYEYPYGSKGGQLLLQKRLTIQDNQPDELKAVRRHIGSSFESITCFLMPHPGKVIATKASFDGRLGDVDAEFIAQLKDFVPFVLGRDRLCPKKVAGRPVLCGELLEYFKAYVAAFESGDVPKPMTIYEATSTANHMAALSTARQAYMDGMEAFVGGAREHVSAGVLKEFHARLMRECMEHFRGVKKIGHPSLNHRYEAQLETELNNAFERFKAQNETKSTFGASSATVLLLFVWFLARIVGSLFSAVGLGSIAGLAHLVGVLSFSTIIAYWYFRQSGNFPEYIYFVGRVTEQIWGFLSRNLFRAAFQEQAQPGQQDEQDRAQPRQEGEAGVALEGVAGALLGQLGALIAGLPMLIMARLPGAPIQE